MGSSQLFNCLLLLSLLGLHSCALADNDDDNSTEFPFVPIFIVVGVVGLVVVLFLFIIYYKKSKKLKKEMKKRNFVQEENIEKVEENVEVIEKREVEREEKGKLNFIDGEACFELNDLLKAPAEGLGKGNFGNCYKAMLDDGLNVVVKRLRDLKPLSHEEFAKQMRAMADLKHPNLLPVLAYYFSKEEKLMVTKFASNGNLYNRIHGGRGTRERIPFRWSGRLSVARGVAQALEYLHIHSSLPHGNLKSSNVLLSSTAVLVADYALASLISLPIASHRMLAFKSPEYQSHKRISKHSDVWTYGCLLLELLTGRPDGAGLGAWVHRAVREEWTAEIFDLEILAQRSASHGMLRLLQIAVRCCDKSPERRPEMSEVVREVESVKAGVELSEDEDDFSVDQSYMDDSMTATPSQ
ncbi:probable inactive receptor kinase At2g26730 [Actinidia eriantha]|uniref:probable inactive receptor kinase At2g26730 n=1 Tax=Actinidia eriantha TaxID=165200 RepID=UPI0025836AC6|nr:probable inactive receptor kinase At2g26730 [Actinidia eriantha]